MRPNDADVCEFNTVDQRLLMAVDSGLAATIFVAPLFMGGRHPLGQLVLVLLSTLTAAAWLVGQCCSRRAVWRHSAAEWVLLAALALVALQIIPLPEAVLPWLSPELASMLPLWSADGSALGPWTQISLSPSETRGGLILLICYVLLFFVAVQRIERLKDIERLLRMAALGSVAMAVLGLVQYLASNGKFLWVYEHPYVDTFSSVRGAFSNRNHFAHFLALGLGPLLWWVHKGLKPKSDSWKGTRPSSHSTNRQALRAGLGWLLLAVVLFALLMSFSRGGAIAMLAAAGVYLTIGWRASLVSRRFAGLMLAASALVGVSLGIHGYRSVATRLDDLASGSLEELDQLQGRRKIWTAVMAAIADFPRLGAGVGSHRALYPRYLQDYTPCDYTHAESGYLQVAEETGLAGATLLMAGLAMCGWWSVQTLRSSTLRGSRRRRLLACLAAASAAIVASAAHSLADFVWYVPSCVTLVALLSACLFHLHRLSRGEEPAVRVSHWPRPAWGLACATVVLVGALGAREFFAAARAEPHWDHWRIAIRNARGLAEVAELMQQQMGAAVRANPGDARAHLGLAEAHLRKFDLAQLENENAMSLPAIRDAALQSKFASREQLDGWLQRALGTSRQHLTLAYAHTRQALRLCPLSGQAYLYLAELGFLDPARPIGAEACLDQALRVRPYEGGVLFKAGEEAALAGNFAQAVEHWKLAFHAGPRVQQQLVAYAAARGFPVEFFLEQFDPDLPGWRQLHAQYRAVTPPENFRRFVEAYAAQVTRAAEQEDEPAAAPLWLEAHGLRVELGDIQAACQAARRAVAADPNHYEARRALGTYLLETGQFAEAEEALKWCQMRRPTDPQVTEGVQRATKGRIDAQTQSAGTSDSAWR